MHAIGTKLHKIYYSQSVLPVVQAKRSMGMHMKIKINIKGISNRENKIMKIEYVYPDREMTLKEFLRETVRITVQKYNKEKESEEVMRCLSGDEILNQSYAGKVSFGIHYGRKKADETEAVNNALQCFEDGMIAVFLDGKRYETLDEMMPLQDGSEATFVRLTFLAGRMY